jgi:hypothetical protein
LGLADPETKNIFGKNQELRLARPCLGSRFLLRIPILAKNPMKPLASALLLVSCLASPVSAPAQTQMGHGLAPCNVYVRSLNNEPLISQSFEAWVIGYVSGLNFALYVTKGVDSLADQNSREIISFVEGFCRSNPSKTVTNAANAYWSSRISRLR